MGKHILRYKLKNKRSFFVKNLIVELKKRAPCIIQVPQKKCAYENGKGRRDFIKKKT